MRNFKASRLLTLVDYAIDRPRREAQGFQIQAERLFWQFERLRYQTNRNNTRIVDKLVGQLRLQVAKDAINWRPSAAFISKMTMAEPGRGAE